MVYSTDKYDILYLGVGAMPHAMVNGQQIMLRGYNLSLNVTQLILQKKLIQQLLPNLSLFVYVYISLYNGLILN